MRSKTMRRAPRSAGVLLAAAVASACASSGQTAAPTTAAPTTTLPPTTTSTIVAPTTSTTVAPTTTSTVPVDHSNDWALSYTEGSAGAADPAMAPITIGFINQEPSLVGFPEASVGIEAAVKYVNAELGGVHGHSVALRKCTVASAVDGTNCANDMLRDRTISFVMTGTLVFGNQEIYATLKGQKPVLIGIGVTTADFLADDAYYFDAGSVGVIPGLAIFSLTELPSVPKTVTVIHANEAGKMAATTLLKPLFDKAGVTMLLVAASDVPTGFVLAQALKDAAADKSDVFIPVVTDQGCIATYDAIKSLGVNPSVITTSQCSGASMSDHLKSLGLTDPVPDGWYFGGYGYSYYRPDDASGMNTYLTKIAKYGGLSTTGAALDYSRFAGPMFANLLTAVKFMNELGPDGITPEAMRDKMKTFTGPMMLQAGPLQCGLGLFKAACAHTIGVEQYTGGQWISAADALNGKPIAVTVYGT
ncbi:MAG: hypothetical protein ABJD24_02220 [Acidimicrobiales bacterium]